MRKYKTPLPSFPKYLPTTEIPNKPKYSGVLTGNGVVVIESVDAAQELHENGCFGVSSRFQKQVVNEKFYEVSEVDTGEVLLVTGKSETSESLSLFPEEAFFLHFALRVLRITDEMGDDLDTKQLLIKFISKEPHFITYYVAYHHFRSKNWVVKQGTNFGSDFLLYKLGPQYYHSQFTVKVVLPEEKFPSKQFLGLYRISETSRKECLVIKVIPPVIGQDPMEQIQNLSQFRVEILTFKRFNLWKGTRGSSST